VAAAFFEAFAGFFLADLFFAADRFSGAVFLPADFLAAVFAATPRDFVVAFLTWERFFLLPDVLGFVVFFLLIAIGEVYHRHPCSVLMAVTAG
jgi:hypothetical protein